MPSQQQLLEVIRIQTEIAKLGLDLGQIMDLVVERTLGLIGADGAAVELAEAGEMVYRASSGIAAPHLGLRLKLDGSLSGLCVRTGETLRCDDAETDPRVDRDACRRVGLRSMIVIPLRFRDETVGVLKAMSHQQARFGAADIRLLSLLSEVVGAAMHFSTEFNRDTLFHQATHDSLTNMANRSLFMDRLRNVVARNERDGSVSGLVMLDIDGLKGINDRYGHRAGDAVICEIASRIQSATRSSDTAARLGGDEFAVILAPVEDMEDVDEAIRRFGKSIQAPFDFENHMYDLRVSIGAACCPGDGTQVDRLIETADQRMYAVKRRRYPAAA